MCEEKCIKCKKSFMISILQMKRRNREKTPMLCGVCMKERQSELAKETLVKYQYNNLSEEDKKIMSQKNSDGLKKHWENANDEQRAKHLSPMRDGWKSWYENIDHDKLSEIRRSWWEKLSEEEKKVYSERMKLYNDSLSKEEKLKRIQQMMEIVKNFSEERKSEMYKKSHQWYYDLPDEKKKESVRKTLISSQGINKLHQRFMRQFSESYISNDYYLRNEEVIVIDNKSKSWDYGVYDISTNELVMVIDLDGSFFHADTCDYNGTHSREEYDERRYQLVPDGVKPCIIYEYEFAKSFEKMIKDLMIDYDAFIKNQFDWCRYNGFPYPFYNDGLLLKSYYSVVKMDCDSKYFKVSTNTRLGDHIIQHFHHSIWYASRGNKLSPYEAWQDDNLLLKVIKNRIIYVNNLNPNKILQGFNISKVGQKVSVFSAGRAKYLIHKYLNGFDEVFDPFSGFSGRMLGTISLGKKYIGQDISPIHVNESKKIMSFLRDHNIKVDAIIQEKDILQSSGEYECLFTCSPYSNIETWFEVPIDKRSCDDWIDECLKRFKCYKYLFVVDDTIKYKNNIVDVIKNKSHFGRNNEYVIMMEGK